MAISLPYPYLAFASGTVKSRFAQMTDVERSADFVSALRSDACRSGVRRRPSEESSCLAPTMEVMSDISRADVAHLARLARLDLKEAELDGYAEQLDAILDAVKRVSEVAADDVPATSHPVPMINVFRDDETRECLPRDEILAAAPAVEDDRFRVPRILDEEA